jgi:hypothetical protein
VAGGRSGGRGGAVAAAAAGAGAGLRFEKVETGRLLEIGRDAGWGLTPGAAPEREPPLPLTLTASHPPPTHEVTALALA